MKRIAGIVFAIQIFAVAGLAFALRETDSRKQTEARPAVELAAEKSAREFIHRLAGVCRQQSDRANEWKSYADVYDFGNAGESEARKAFEEFEAAMDQELNPNALAEPGKDSAVRPFDPAAVRRIFGQAATGFERAAGIKSEGAAK